MAFELRVEIFLYREFESITPLDRYTNSQWSFIGEPRSPHGAENRRASTAFWATDIFLILSLSK